MGKKFFFINDSALSGVENMARDVLLLEYVNSLLDEKVTYLRFYRWIVPTLSIGRNQDVEMAADIEFCRENGIDIVRRPTGGKAVLHHLEVTYSIVSNDFEFFGDSLLKTYKKISDFLCKGLNSLGISAEIVSGTLEKTLSDLDLDMDLPCFTSTSEYEIVVDGRKIVGSAQRRLKNSFLQHGSIMYDISVDLYAGAMKVKKGVIESSVTSILEHAKKDIAYGDIIDKFTEAFKKSFGNLEKIDFPEELLDKIPEYTDRFKVIY